MRVHELLQQKMLRQGLGTVSQVEAALRVGKDYFSSHRKRKTLDHGALLSTLHALNIDPWDFFAELYGPGKSSEDPDDPDGGRSASAARGSAGEDSTGKGSGTGGRGGQAGGMEFGPEDPELATRLEPWIEEMDDLRYDDCEAALLGLRQRARGIPLDAGARWLAVAGSCLRMAGDLGYARLCLDGAMAIAPSDVVRANVLQRQAYVEMNEGELDEALALAERAGGIYTRNGDRGGLGQTLVAMGQFLWHQGAVPEAIRAMEEATHHALESDRRHWSVIHQVLALCHGHQGRNHRAYRHIRKARGLAPDSHMRARAHGVRATILEGMRRWPEAARAYQSAFHLLDEPLERLICLACLVRARALAGSPAGAVEAARSAVYLMGSVKGAVAESAVLELYRLTVADCARRTVVDGVIAKLSALAAKGGEGDTLGDRLRRARRRVGVDRREVALELGVAEVSLKKIETGATPGYKYGQKVREWIEGSSAEVQLARAALPPS